MTTIRFFALFLLALSMPGVSFAQSSETEELRFYDVEVIIFKNLRVPKGEELILPISSPRKDSVILDFSSPASIKTAGEKGYQVLADSQLRLPDKAASIKKSSYYELLMHVGWRQPGLDKEKALPIWVRGGRVYGDEFVSIDSQLTTLASNPENQINVDTLSTNQSSGTRGNYEKIYELEGKITVALSRYLHTYTDLVLRRPRLSLDQTLENPEAASQISGAVNANILDNHILKEHRRMRSKTLHYLDNPEFGLIILITPVEKNTADTASAETS